MNKPSHDIGGGVLFFAEDDPAKIVLCHQVVEQDGGGEVGVSEDKGAFWLQVGAALLNVSGKDAT